MKHILFVLAVALALPTLAQEASDRFDWFHDANVQFSLLRAELHRRPPLDANVHREFRGRCLELSTEYNKRAADITSKWFERRQLPASLKASDCA